MIISFYFDGMSSVGPPKSIWGLGAGMNKNVIYENTHVYPIYCMN